MSEIDRQKLRAGNFVANNGQVLRTINILRYKYNKLGGVQRAMHDAGLSEDEFLDSVNFLSQEGYIHLRRIADHTDGNLADHDYLELEGKVTSKGIRLLAGGIDDNMVEV